jgi:hypothetical protein
VDKQLSGAPVGAGGLGVYAQTCAKLYDPPSKNRNNTVTIESSTQLDAPLAQRHTLFDSDAKIIEALKRGPVMVSLNIDIAGQNAFSEVGDGHLEEDIYKPGLPPRDRAATHVVIVLGFGSFGPDADYWVVLNGWGPTGRHPGDENVLMWLRGGGRDDDGVPDGQTETFKNGGSQVVNAFQDNAYWAEPGEDIVGEYGGL